MGRAVGRAAPGGQRCAAGRQHQTVAARTRGAAGGGQHMAVDVQACPPAFWQVMHHLGPATGCGQPGAKVCRKRSRRGSWHAQKSVQACRLAGSTVQRAAACSAALPVHCAAQPGAHLVQRVAAAFLLRLHLLLPVQGQCGDLNVLHQAGRRQGSRRTKHKECCSTQGPRGAGTGRSPPAPEACGCAAPPPEPHAPEAFQFSPPQLSRWELQASAGSSPERPPRGGWCRLGALGCSPPIERHVPMSGCRLPTAQGCDQPALGTCVAFEGQLAQLVAELSTRVHSVVLANVGDNSAWGLVTAGPKTGFLVLLSRLPRWHRPLPCFPCFRGYRAVSDHFLPLQRRYSHDGLGRPASRRVAARFCCAARPLQPRSGQDDLQAVAQRG